MTGTCSGGSEKTLVHPVRLTRKFQFLLLRVILHLLTIPEFRDCDALFDETSI